MSQSETPGVPDPWASVPRASAAPPQRPGVPGPGYGPYPQSPHYYPGYQQRRTNSMSIAAMVCGICGFIYLVPALLGIVFGLVALRQINRDKTDGRGFAITGIVTGVLWIVGFVILIVAIITIGVDNAGQ